MFNSDKSSSSTSSSEFLKYNFLSFKKEIILSEFDRLTLRFDWVENSNSPESSSPLMSILLEMSNIFLDVLPERLESIFIFSEDNDIVPSRLLLLINESVIILNSLSFLIKFIFELIKFNSLEDPLMVELKSK